MSKDASGFTPEQRHKVIVDTLKEIKKDTKVFHLRWCPGDLLNEKTLKSTPIFWYMRFGWSREDVETLFLKARIFVDPVFEQACDKVFGSEYKGPRWLPPDEQARRREQWAKRGFKRTNNIWWKTKKMGALHASQVPAKDYQDIEMTGEKRNYNRDANDPNYGGKRTAGNEAIRSRKSLLDRKLVTERLKIWQAMSKFGEDKKVNSTKFRDNMKEAGVTMNPLIAEKLFNSVAPGGVLDQSKLDKLLKDLDNIKMDLNGNIGNIMLKDLDNPLEAQLMMKRVLLAAAMDMPFSVDEFMLNKVASAHMAPGILLGKLATREFDWDFRAKAMEDLSNALGADPQYNEYFEPENMSNLLMGWMTQTLDEREQVSKPAINALPHVYDQMLENGDTDQAIGHLEDIVDALFKVLDNPRYKNNRKDAEEALKDVIDNVVKRGGPEAVLYAMGLLSEQMDTENNTNPEARRFAMEQLKKILFGEGGPDWAKVKPDTKPGDLADSFPDDGTPNREYLDMATGKQKGPSDELMASGYDDSDAYDQRGRKNRFQAAGGGGVDDPSWGGDNEEMSGKGKKQGVDYGSDDEGGRGRRDDDEDPRYGGASQSGRNEDPYENYEADDPDLGDDERLGNPNNKLYGSGGKDGRGGPNDGNGDPNDPRNKGRNKGGKGLYGSGGKDGDRRGRGDGDGDGNGDDDPNNPNNKKNLYGSGGKNPRGGGRGDDDPSGKGRGNKGGKDLRGSGGKNGDRGRGDDNDPNNRGKGKDGKGLYGSGGPNDRGDGDDLVGLGPTDFGDDKDTDPSNRGGDGSGRGDPNKGRKKGGKGRNPSGGGSAGNNDNAGDRDKTKDFASGRIGGGTGNDAYGDDEKGGPDDRSAEDIGDEIRQNVADGIKNAITDPNKKNAEDAAKLVHALNAASPGYPKNLDKEAQNKYFKWKSGPFKGGKKRMPNKKLPPINAAEKRLHKIDQNIEVFIAPPTMPDL